MRIAVGIIGIVLSFVVGAQALLVYGFGSAVDNQEGAGAGAVGVLVALLFFVAGAFSFGLPQVAMVLFAVAGLLALAFSGAFTDLVVWGVVGLVLALLAFLGWRGKRRSDRRALIERQSDVDRAVAAGLAASAAPREPAP